MIKLTQVASIVRRNLFHPIATLAIVVVCMGLAFVYVPLSLLVSLLAGESFSPNQLIVFLTALYLLVTYFLLYASWTTTRLATINWINDFLSPKEPGKDLLLEEQHTLESVMSSSKDKENLRWVAAKLNRVAAAAMHADVVDELLELHWDWYFHLFQKYGAFLKEHRKDAADLYASSGGVLALTSQDDDSMNVWLYYLSEMKRELDRFLRERVEPKGNQGRS